jgi:hypothetical protein
MIGMIVSYKTLIGQKEKDKPELFMLDEVNEIYKELENKDSRNVLLSPHYFTKRLDEVKIEIREKLEILLHNLFQSKLKCLLKNFMMIMRKINHRFHFVSN